MKNTELCIISRENVTRLMDTYEDIGDQAMALHNMVLLLNEYIGMFEVNDGKSFAELGADAKGESYKLQLVSDYLYRVTNMIDEKLVTLGKIAYEDTAKTAVNTADQIKLIDEMYMESYDQEEDFPNCFNILKVPTFMDDRDKAFDELNEALKKKCPDTDIVFGECLTEFEDAISKASFRTGFLCALALNKVTRIE